MTQTCCPKSTFKEFEKKMKGFYNKKFNKLKEMKKFLIWIQKIDMAMWYNMIRTANDQVKKCLPENTDFLIDAVKLLKIFTKESLDSYSIAIKHKLSYTISQQCSMCDPVFNHLLIVDKKNDRFEIKLSDQEIKNFIYFSNKTYLYRKIKHLSIFLDCAHQKNQLPFPQNFKYYFKSLEDEDDYQKIVDEPLKMKEKEDFNLYLLRNHPMVESISFNLHEMIE